MSPVLLCLLAAAIARPAAPALQDLPVLAAKSAAIDVRDGDRLLEGAWLADPAVALDVYSALRTTAPKRVTFVSDLGELAFDVEPGRTYDFVIRLAGQGDCRTRISALRGGYARVDAARAAGPDAIPISIESGKLHVRGRLGGSPELDFVLDTGAEIHAIYPSAEDKGVTLRYDGTTTNSGTGGTTERRTSSDNELEIAGLRWSHEPVLGIEKQVDAADGIVGFGLFDGKVVELDFERMLLVLHDALPAGAAGFGRTELHWSGALPALEIGLIGDGADASGVFVIDTGGTGTMLVDRAFAQAHALYDAFERLGTSSSRGVGAGVIENAVLRVPTLVLAGFRLADVPIHAELPTSGGTAPPGGVVCMDVLRRFHAFLDFPHGVAYFQPDRSFGEPFQSPRSGPRIAVLAGLAAIALLAALAFCVSRRGGTPRAGAD